MKHYQSQEQIAAIANWFWGTKNFPLQKYLKKLFCYCIIGLTRCFWACFPLLDTFNCTRYSEHVELKYFVQQLWEKENVTCVHLVPPNCRPIITLQNYHYYWYASTQVDWLSHMVHLLSDFEKCSSTFIINFISRIVLTNLVM